MDAKWYEYLGWGLVIISAIVFILRVIGVF